MKKHFYKLYEHVSLEKNDKYILVFGNKVYKVRYISCSEDENNFPENDPRYEYFDTIIFEGEKEEEWFEIDYKNLPDKIYQNNVLILEKPEKRR